MRIKCRTSTTIGNRFRVQLREALSIVGGAEFPEHVCELVGVQEIRGEQGGKGQGTQTMHPLPWVIMVILYPG
jgi:hypothetical protein